MQHLVNLQLVRLLLTRLIMDNLIVAVSMMFVIRKYKNNSIARLIAISCLSLELLSIINLDIALYYSIASAVCIATALFALELKTTSGFILSILMSVQAMLALPLIPDWGYQSNIFLQFMLTNFNATMVVLLISLGFIGSDNDGPTKRDNNI